MIWAAKFALQGLVLGAWGAKNANQRDPKEVAAKDTTNCFRCGCFHCC